MSQAHVQAGRRHLFKSCGRISGVVRLGYGEGNTCSGHRLPDCTVLPLQTPLFLLYPALSALLFHPPRPPTPPPLHPQSSLPPCTCVCMQELNTFKGVRRGPSNPQRRLGSGSPPSRFIASVLPKSYFTVPSIRSLGSPQLPSPDAGLSPSLGTRTGHGERGGM